jgi:hypothetical protein
MDVEIGTVAVHFLFWKYLFQIFGIGSLQCRGKLDADSGPKSKAGYKLQMSARDRKTFPIYLGWLTGSDGG